MDDTLRSLLDGIPSDPLTAFVVADYLEEQSDPRAEVLRLVYNLTRTTRIAGGRTIPEARLRELLYTQKVQPISPTLELTLPQDVPLQLAWVPPGKFKMGSTGSEKGRDHELPSHSVTLTKGFWIGVYLVTQLQWRAVMSTDISSANQGDQYPVDNISWQLATNFCVAASQQTGCTVRLPTEAEWEYACRAGTTTAYHFGNEIDQTLVSYDIRNQSERNGTALVGSYPPNGFGLYDVHGNLYEWVHDAYDKDYYKRSPRVNPPGPPSTPTSHRVLRGGSWYYRAAEARSAHRIECSYNYSHFDQGFRVVCERSEG